MAVHEILSLARINLFFARVNLSFTAEFGTYFWIIIYFSIVIKLNSKCRFPQKNVFNVENHFFQ